MKTKFEILFHTWVDATIFTDLAVLVAKHNGKIGETDLNTIAAYFKAYCVRWSYDGEVITEPHAINLKLRDVLFVTIKEKTIIASLQIEDNEAIYSY